MGSKKKKLEPFYGHYTVQPALASSPVLCFDTILVWSFDP